MAASSVAAAIEKLTDEETPDLLISDINLPGRDGFELIAWCDRALPNKAAIYRRSPLQAMPPASILRAYWRPAFSLISLSPLIPDELMATIVNLV